MEIRLLEASPRLGGSIRTAQRDGFLLEAGPECVLTEKPRILEFCRELGLESELISTQTQHRRSFVVKSGRLHPVPEGFYLIGPSHVGHFLRSSLISWRGKWRVLCEPFIPVRHYEDESLASFVRRRLGEEVLERLAQPLLAGIYAADPETLSLRATFPQFLEMERRGRGVLQGLKARSSEARSASGARYSLFVSFRKGLQTLVDRLERCFAPGTIQKGVSVREIRRTASGARASWMIVQSDGGVMEADGICLALPAYRAAGLVRSLNSHLAHLLEEVPYASTATVSFAFRKSGVRHPLNGFGFVVPRVENRFLLACTFSHRKFEGRAPEDCVLLRCFAGGAHEEHALEADDSVLERQAVGDLRDLLGLSDDPLFSIVERHEKAIPQYLLGHLERWEKIKRELKSLPGLVLAGNWMNGVGIPQCVESGERAGEDLVSYLEAFSLV